MVSSGWAIDGSVARALDRVDSLAAAAAGDKGAAAAAAASDAAVSVRLLCAPMDSAALLGFVVARRKEADALRAGVPPALKLCVDPARFVMDAGADVFPVDRRVVKSPADLAWACVLILEAPCRRWRTRTRRSGRCGRWCRGLRGSVRGMAREWKEAAKRKGGVVLQHVAAVAEEDRPLYRRIVVSFSWHRQMPRLELTLGLEEEMADPS